jgi:hypothetical protein
MIHKNILYFILFSLILLTGCTTNKNLVYNKTNYQASQLVSNVSEPTINEEGYIEIYISGYFSPHTYPSLKKIYKKYYNHKIIIHANSQGGYANDIFKIMNMILNHGKTTFIVSEKSVCDSMCAYTGLVAKKRQGLFSFHAIHDIKKQLHPKYNNAIFLYLIKSGIDFEKSKKITSSLDFVNINFNE